ncbi:hypothetical protein V6N11_067467 [Hibiscus sabdariffa]|uniref:RNase H type-1 domain-containing protein n=1 Tax=Hibiscus sabdariffa TaxID=183260 RepID=A0ABR2SQV4_9ROSI
MEAARILQHQSDALSDHALVSALRQLLSHDWDLEFKHIHCSTNGVADGLACLTCGAPVGAWNFRKPPTEVAAALLKDLHDLV